MIRHVPIFRRRISDEVPAFRGRGPAAGAGPAVLVVALAAMIVIAAALGAPAPARAHASSFTDVSPTEPAHAAVEYLAGADVISGYPDGTFRPGAALNRGQAAKILVRQRGLPTEAGASRRFSDVDALYGPYVETAADKGWITGYSDGTFRPYAGLQRQHMAVIMVRSLGWAEAAEALTASQITGAAGRLQRRGRDRGRGSTLCGHGAGPRLVPGRHADDRLSPGTSITRGQFSLVAYRAELRDLAVAGRDPGRSRPSGHDPRGLRSLRRAGSGHKSHEWLQRAGHRCGEGGRRGRGSRLCPWARPRCNARPRGSSATVHRWSRITLTLDRFSRFEVSTLPPSDGKGDRIVVDVFKRADGPPGGGPPLIALDAGHGGKDTGAIGVTGVKEKDINLAITLEVDKILREAGLRTMLTRSDDSYPTLQERTDLANQAQASIFVAIHNNAAGDPTSAGTETFYWGTDAEYSVEGKRLAQAIQRNLIAALGSADRGARTHWNNLHVLGGEPHDGRADRGRLPHQRRGRSQAQGSRLSEDGPPRPSPGVSLSIWGGRPLSAPAGG